MKKSEKKLAKEKEVQKKEVGFITVVDAIVGIIVAIFCLLALIGGFYLIGALFFVLTIFIFLPQKVLKFSKWLKLLIGIVGFFVLLAIIGLNLPSQESVFEIYSLNEPFILNYDEVNLSMVVYNATKEDKIILNGEERTSEGFFIKVNGALINLVKLPVNIGINVWIMDSQNNSYTPLGYNLGEGPLQPNLRREIFHIFEIPKQSSGLKLFIKDKTKIIKVVDLKI